MIRLLILFLVGLSIVCANKYTQFSGEIIYFGSHYLHEWKGESKIINGFIYYDKNSSEYSCDLRVPIASFDSKNGNRDSNMLIYTNALEFSDIHFKSTHITINEDKASVEGILNFAGESKDIVTNVDIQIKNDISFSGTLMIKLSDYKIIRPSLLFKKIDDEIKIEFSIRTDN